MGSSDLESLKRALCQHLNTIHETRQVLDRDAVSLVSKESWSNVVKMGEELSKKATTVGMLWTGEIPNVKVLEENMTAYFNLLQGFLLLSHGTTVGAGCTLSSFIHDSVNQVVDSSFILMKECVSSYGSSHRTGNLAIPALVGRVWDACTALKKTPSTNVTAIGRAMTKVTVTMKDVLREMKELKPASSDLMDEVPGKSSESVENGTNDSDDSCSGDLGNDLSEEEMKVAQLTADFVSEIIGVINNLVRVIVGLLKCESNDDLSNSINTLENVLKFCQGIGAEVDELGACLYPPQELHTIKVSVRNISSIMNDIQVGLENLGASSEDFVLSCISFRTSLSRLESELGSSDNI